MTNASAASPRALLLALVAIYVLLWSQFAWVSVVNFEGFDEWLTLSLTSRGLVAVPHANRPLGLMWNLPAAVLFPHSLVGAFIVHVHYLGLAGLLVSLLIWRLLPEEPVLAFLAGVFTVTWVPSDPLRLSAIYSSAYAGITMAVLAAALLVLEAERRRLPALTLVAAVVAFAAARSHEGTIPLLLVVPLVAFRRRRSLPAIWLAAFWGAVAAAAVLAALPMVLSGSEGWYQGSLLEPDFSLRGLLSRELLQFRLHLLPLVSTSPAVLLVAAVPVAAGAFVAFYVLIERNLPPAAETSGRKLLWTTLVGLGAAGLGYSAFVPNSRLVGASRTEFLAAPGIGLALASAVCLVATWLPLRWRRLAPAALGAWIVALGTGRTAAIQAQWERYSFYPRQNRILSQLVELAPDLRPGTLVVLLDDAGSWPASFTFRHAVRYLYEGRALGHSPNSWQIFYPVSLGPDGARSEPWPVIREAWRESPSVHRYGELVVVRGDPSGRLSLLEEWPSQSLPPLPPGARYDPRARILSRTLPAPSWAVLTRRSAP